MSDHDSADRPAELLEPGAPGGALGLGVPRARTDPDTGVKTCPVCEEEIAEEYSAQGEQLTASYVAHYVFWHASLPDPS